MGAGTAAMMTMMLRESAPDLAAARCYAIACPSCMTPELARSCREYVTSIMNGTDIVPTFRWGGGWGRGEATKEETRRALDGPSARRACCIMQGTQGH